jgi:hypothetical protein
MQELASFGYIVFGLDHLDGSGNYTMLQGNKCMVFNTEMDRSKFSPGQEGQHAIFRMNDERRMENLILIDEIFKDDFLTKRLGFLKTAKIDTE